MSRQFGSCVQVEEVVHGVAVSGGRLHQAGVEELVEHVLHASRRLLEQGSSQLDTEGPGVDHRKAPEEPLGR